ncbi:cysteine desulfurase family protein [Candidatus Izemoplasma sp. B36]|uniref:cysteine desulfurase family protein n=1 Tax=Candidatus Izemoplasma sp. B36 TaxID=3242468 RepID=UPI00355866D2
MIYLDYSATTPVNKKVLDEYYQFNIEHFANPNSSHQLGLLVKEKIEETTKKIQYILNADAYEVIYTSGATESNNLAIVGYALSNQHIGKHIITSPYEHSSVTTCMNYLAKLGFEIDVLGIKEDGLLDLEELDELIRKDTILVSIAYVNSELGIKQDLERIKTIVKKYSGLKLHSDLTQAIGKLKVDLKDIDLVSFSGHKIYGLKGIGALLRKKHIKLTPVIHGGKSTSIFRGGTPPAPLIYSLGIALELAYQDFDNKLLRITNLKEYLLKSLKENIKIAHPNYINSIPQINNVSFPNIEAHIIKKALSEKDIYISTQTACNSESSFSITVKKITDSEALAESSIRISLSHLTKEIEIDTFILELKEIINENS